MGAGPPGIPGADITCLPTDLISVQPTLTELFFSPMSHQVVYPQCLRNSEDIVLSPGPSFQFGSYTPDDVPSANRYAPAQAAPVQQVQQYLVRLLDSPLPFQFGSSTPDNMPGANCYASAHAAPVQQVQQYLVRLLDSLQLLTINVYCKDSHAVAQVR